MNDVNKCLKCGHTSDVAFGECPKCGVIIEKFLEKEKKLKELDKDFHKTEGNLEEERPGNLFITIISNIKLVLLILTLVSILVWYIFIKESSKDIIQGTIINIERGILEYDNKQYKATWGEEKTYSGYVRYIGQAKNKYVPFMTNEVILTTGDFSDPSLVTIGPVRNHSTFWTAQKQPKGELYFVHCVPLDLSVLRALEGIKQGQWVELTGKQTTAIYGPGDVLYWQTLKASHPTFLVTDVYYSEEVSN